MSLICLGKTDIRYKEYMGKFLKRYRCTTCNSEYLSLFRKHCDKCGKKTRIYQCKYCGFLCVAPIGANLGHMKYCNNKYCAKQSKRDALKKKKTNNKNRGTDQWKALGSQPRNHNLAKVGSYSNHYPDSIGI